MTTLAEFAPKATYRFCIFGRAKVGKTVLAAQIARIGRLWWFDLEDGIKSAMNPSLLPQEFWKNINLFPIQSHQKSPLGIETLLKIVDGKAHEICWEHGKIGCQLCQKASKPFNRICLNEFTTDDWLVIDSTTQLSTDASFATNPVIRGANEAAEFVLDKDTGGKDFKYPMAVAFVLDRVFGTLQNSRINTIVISHEVMTERTKDTGRVVKAGENQPGDNVEMLFPAAGSRNFSRNFGRYFDMLIYCDVVNRTHRAYSSTVYSGNVQTGSRLPVNIEEVLGPDKKPLAPNLAIVEMIKLARAAANGSHTPKS